MTDRLVTDANFEDPDGFYASYVAAHEGLSAAASALLAERLVLILANHIGDRAILDQALRLAAAAPPVSPSPDDVTPR